jgi:heme-degrading monooxygenase HmoA
VEEDKERVLLDLIATVRAKASHHRDFVSSEVLWNTGGLNEVLSIAEWRSLKAWEKFLEDEDSKRLQKKIDELGCETRFEVFTHPDPDEKWNMPGVL